MWAALFGAMIGALVGNIGTALLGLVTGAALGWQGARLRALRRELDNLRRADREIRPARPPGEQPAPGVAPGPAVPGVPIAEPGSTSGAAQTTPTESLELTAAGTAATRSAHAESTAGAVTGATPAATASRTAARIDAPGVPDDPTWLAQRWQDARDWMLSGNVPAKIGMLVLLFGFAAGLKHSIDAGWLHVPIAARLSAIALAGVFAIFWGWRSHEVRPAFGLSLQGGGIGILLLTLFAAHRLYLLVPALPAFALVVLLVAGAAALAVLQDSLALAVLGFLGGYLAPVLLATGAGSHVTLFSFYAVLNLAVFAIAWLRHWRALNLLGFVFTFAIGLSWGLNYYRPEHFGSVEPFLVLFFLFYVAIVVLHAVRAPQERRGIVDGSLLFGTPLLAFGLQAAMLYEQPMVLAWTALAMALLYALLAWRLLRDERLRLLGQSFAVLALGFGTLAVPLALSARSTSSIWALEGAALVWLGLRQKRLLPQITGVGLQLAAGLVYVAGLAGIGFPEIRESIWLARPGEWIVLNAHALGTLLLALAAFASSWLFERAGRGRWPVWSLFLLGTAWWFWGGVRELDQHVGELGLRIPPIGNAQSWVLFAAVSLVVMAALRRFSGWARPGWNVVLFMVFSVPLGFLGQYGEAHALHGALGASWLVWLVLALVALAWLRTPRQRGLDLAHAAFLASLSVAWGFALAEIARAAGLGVDWELAAGLLPWMIFGLLTWRWPAVGAFPLAQEYPDHAACWNITFGSVLLLVWVHSLPLPGDAAPLRFVPLLNPLELVQLLGVVLAIRLARRDTSGTLVWLAGAAGFIMLSLAGLRAVHQYTGLPWSPELLAHAPAQATLTILWAIGGVVCWVLGSRRQSRGLWLLGAIGMGLVLAKLVLVDRQHVGNLAGIISFLAVGGLLVLVGRIAPTPPRRTAPHPE